MSGPTGARPTGVTVVAVLALIAGVLGLVATATIFGLGGRTAAFSGVITLAISLADLAMGYGFWMLRPWSWQLAFALVFISPVWEIVRFLYRGADPLNLVVAIVFAGIWLYFLNLPSIRTIFGAPTSGFPIVGHALDPILGGRK
jgi:hypothetical protein